MSDPIIPLRQWPEGITQASVPANDNALRNEALSMPALGVANDAPGTEENGDVYIVGNTPDGEFAAFDEHDIALFRDGWHAWSPVVGVRLVVNDVRKIFDGSAWVDDPAGGGGSGDVGGPASSTTGNIAVFADGTGKEIEDGGTLGDLAFIDDAPSDGSEYVRKDGAWEVASGGGGGGSLTGFTASLETAPPNNTINASVLAASGGTTNQDAVVSPKGTGAFSLNLADSSSSGGNVRGSGAIDLQTNRSNANQVASGNYSFVAGTSNRASGGFSVALGSNSASTAHSAISIGEWCTASGGQAVAIGSNCTASSACSVALGFQNTAGGQSSWIPGGEYGTTRGISGSGARAAGRFSVAGDAQSMCFVLRRSTTNATPNVATSTGTGASSTNQVTLANNSAFAVKATVAVRENATGDTASWDVTACIKRGANAASTALVGAPSVTAIGADAGAAAWALAVVADTTNGALQFQVTGEASRSLKWVVDVYSCVQVVG